MPYASKIANELLWSPFDGKSVHSIDLANKLNEKEFIEKCFSLPRFLASQSPLKLSEFEEIEISNTVAEFQNQFNDEKNRYEKFENWLSMFNNHKVFTLCGNSGTGKTTFLYYLKYTKTNYNWAILNVAKYKKRITWYNPHSTIVNQPQLAIQKLYAVVLEEIYKYTFDVSEDCNNRTETILNKFFLLISNYKNNFSEGYLLGSEFFESLSQILNKEESSVSKVQELAKTFSEYFVRKENEDLMQQLNYALDILLLVMRCSSTNKNLKHVIVFDNIERFIANDEIFNEELDRIRIGLAAYSREINVTNQHSNKIKFIMSMRCNTIRQHVNLDPADEESCNIDISSWFDINDILYLKRKWFKENKIEIDNLDILMKIIGDIQVCRSGDITGLKPFLSALFNDNKRLLIDFIGIIIEQLDNFELYDYQQDISNYISCLNIKNLYGSCAARNIIKGLVLYRLKNSDNLFHHLQVYFNSETTGENIPGSGLTRKILTVLYNKQLLGEKVVHLSDVLKTIYASRNIANDWISEDFMDNRTKVSKILFYLNSYNRRNNDWIQFVDLQYKNNNDNVFIESEDDLANLLFNHLDKFRITLMPSGKIYLEKIMTSFEYFSVCFNEKYRPLYSLIPSEKEIEKCTNFDALQCIIIIKNVFEKSKKICASSSDIEINIPNKPQYIYARRVVDSHIRYLGNFTQFINNQYVYNGSYEEKTRKKYQLLVNSIRKYMREYEKI